MEMYHSSFRRHISRIINLFFQMVVQWLGTRLANKRYRVRSRILVTHNVDILYGLYLHQKSLAVNFKGILGVTLYTYTVCYVFTHSSRKKKHHCLLAVEAEYIRVCQNLKPFIGNGDVLMRFKKFQAGHKTKKVIFISNR